MQRMIRFIRTYLQFLVSELSLLSVRRFTRWRCVYVMAELALDPEIAAVGSLSAIDLQAHFLHTWFHPGGCSALNTLRNYLCHSSLATMTLAASPALTQQDTTYARADLPQLEPLCDFILTMQFQDSSMCASRTQLSLSAAAKIPEVQ